MFKYDPHALRKTIDDVNIHIPQGKVTAIVGASGSGKTTLIRLMLGYYPVLEGKITIGDTDINQTQQEVVAQTVWCCDAGGCHLLGEYRRQT